MKKGKIGKAFLGGTVPYKEDPFDRRREFEKKEREEHHKLLQEKPFSQRVRVP